MRDGPPSSHGTIHASNPQLLASLLQDDNNDNNDNNDSNDNVSSTQNGEMHPTSSSSRMSGNPVKRVVLEDEDEDEDDQYRFVSSRIEDYDDDDDENIEQANLTVGVNSRNGMTQNGSVLHKDLSVIENGGQHLPVRNGSNIQQQSRQNTQLSNTGSRQGARQYSYVTPAGPIQSRQGQNTPTYSRQNDRPGSKQIVEGEQHSGTPVKNGGTPTNTGEFTPSGTDFSPAGNQRQLSQTSANQRQPSRQPTQTSANQRQPSRQPTQTSTNQRQPSRQPTQTSANKRQTNREGPQTSANQRESRRQSAIQAANGSHRNSPSNNYGQSSRNGLQNEQLGDAAQRGRSRSQFDQGEDGDEEEEDEEDDDEARPTDSLDIDAADLQREEEYQQMLKQRLHEQEKSLHDTQIPPLDFNQEDDLDLSLRDDRGQETWNSEALQDSLDAEAQQGGGTYRKEESKPTDDLSWKNPPPIPFSRLDDPDDDPIRQTSQASRVHYDPNTQDTGTSRQMRRTPFPQDHDEQLPDEGQGHVRERDFSRDSIDDMGESLDFRSPLGHQRSPHVAQNQSRTETYYEQRHPVQETGQSHATGQPVHPQRMVRQDAVRDASSEQLTYGGRISRSRGYHRGSQPEEDVMPPRQDQHERQYEQDQYALRSNPDKYQSLPPDDGYNRNDQYYQRQAQDDQYYQSPHLDHYNRNLPPDDRYVQMGHPDDRRPHPAYQRPHPDGQFYSDQRPPPPQSMLPQSHNNYEPQMYANPDHSYGGQFRGQFQSNQPPQASPRNLYREPIGAPPRDSYREPPQASFPESYREAPQPSPRDSYREYSGTYSGQPVRPLNQYGQPIPQEQFYGHPGPQGQVYDPRGQVYDQQGQGYGQFAPQGQGYDHGGQGFGQSGPQGQGYVSQGPYIQNGPSSVQQQQYYQYADDPQAEDDGMDGGQRSGQPSRGERSPSKNQNQVDFIERNRKILNEGAPKKTYGQKFQEKKEMAVMPVPRLKPRLSAPTEGKTQSGKVKQIDSVKKNLKPKPYSADSKVTPVKATPEDAPKSLKQKPSSAEDLWSKRSQMLSQKKEKSLTAGLSKNTGSVKNGLRKFPSESKINFRESKPHFVEPLQHRPTVPKEATVDPDPVPVPVRRASVGSRESVSLDIRPITQTLWTDDGQRVSVDINLKLITPPPVGPLVQSQNRDRPVGPLPSYPSHLSDQFSHNRAIHQPVGPIPQAHLAPVGPLQQGPQYQQGPQGGYYPQHRPPPVPQPGWEEQTEQTEQYHYATPRQGAPPGQQYADSRQYAWQHSQGPPRDFYDDESPRLRHTHPEVHGAHHYETLPPIGSHGKKAEDKQSPVMRAVTWRPSRNRSSPRGSTAYTINDYRKLKKEIQLGGLGPDLDNQTLRERTEKRQKQLQYAKQVKEQQKQTFKPGRPRPQGTAEDKEKEDIMNRRKLAMEYAKSIPKPQVASRHPTEFNSYEIAAGRAGSVQPQSPSRAASSKTAEQEMEDLMRLKERHDSERRAVAELKQHQT
ncbi:LOW QUALITY PROTEIN: bromodomain-containing protein 4-like [Lingula anatina]|uniref:LOW QUALITY PROTEIN: bromodomain-containing protein 4-like n=1 Tax=Lingula anatina TaxID=7574 RepID=A0A1S3I750_LINAN|nr:LOW QUALITY PROTEIN: bromodomain-containing protein 4-like [Lingula anatina]|eukprot:XP_013394105.1 LOW QUALITY PROTEIN: bromodomain-containing protein 4-like [Lingula anatina]